MDFKINEIKVNNKKNKIKLKSILKFKVKIK